VSVLLRHNATSLGNWFPTFPDKVFSSFWRVAVFKNLLGHFDPRRLDSYIVCKYREPIRKWRRVTSQKDEYPRTVLYFMKLKDSVMSSQQPATGLHPAQHEFQLQISVLLGPLTWRFLTKNFGRFSSVPCMLRALSESPHFISRVSLDEEEKN